MSVNLFPLPPPQRKSLFPPTSDPLQGSFPRSNVKVGGLKKSLIAGYQAGHPNLFKTVPTAPVKLSKMCHSQLTLPGPTGSAVALSPSLSHLQRGQVC